MLPIITDHYPVEMLLECKFVNFIKTLAKSNNKSVSYMGNYMSSDCRSTYGHNIRHLYLKYDITYQECLEMSMNQIKKKFYSTWLQTVNDDYINSAVMIREVILMKDRISQRFFDDEQCEFLINFLGTK